MDLKASTFHTSKLMKKLLDNKILLTFLYYEAQIKSKRFFLQKRRLITKFIPFVKGNLAKHHYLTTLNRGCKHT